MNPASTPLTFDTYQSCNLCPRMCGVNRNKDIGFCGCGSRLKAARAALHHWEEPCISGPEHAPGGSGTIFFSGCTLRCCFCQNHPISSGNFGKEISAEMLSDVFLRLQEQGAYNINLVTGTQYLPHIVSALDKIRHKLSIPVVFNCGGYERAEVIQALKDYIDIWLPDFKYYDNRLAFKYSRVDDYFERASSAVIQMIEQTGAPVYGNPTSDPDIHILEKGVIIRHMVLPNHKDDSIALLQWMKERLPAEDYMISLLSQYTPFYRSAEYPELNRRVTSYEYDKVVDTAICLGLTQGFIQKKSSAKEEYTPPFNLEGL